MRKTIIIGSISVVLIMLLLPVSSIADSNSAIERIEKQQEILKIVQENISPTDWEPACILRLLLWLRNAIIFLGILVVVNFIKNLFNISSISASR